MIHRHLVVSSDSVYTLTLLLLLYTLRTYTYYRRVKPRKKHAGKRGHPTSKRGSSQQNHLDQTQSREFGQMEEGESHLEDDHGA